MIALLFSLIYANPTYNLPNAAVLSSEMSIYAGSGMAALRAGPLPSIRLGGTWQKDAWMLHANSTLYIGQSNERFDNVSFRYLLVQNPSFRLAPTVMLSHHEGATELDRRTTGRLGLAMDAGKGKWKWDLSINVVGMGYRMHRQDPVYMLSTFDTLVAFESGFRYEFSEQHFFRFALLGPMPTLRYGIPFGKGNYRIDITGATLGTQNLLQFDVVRILGQK
ncbi:MAG: hypothetical protein CL916_11460 [Deltaproteobacteria bacterium]|nr:hypothetical protein [Deltaproteobacteria bacterium]